MAKNSPSRKLLRDCIDPILTKPDNLGMAQKRAAPRLKRRTYRRTFIRQWRDYRELTLERLAERVGMTAGNLSQIERGNQPYSQATLEALAEALQTDVASLLMRDPSETEGLWSIWDQAKQGQKRQIVEIAKTIVKTGTDEQ